MLRDVNKGQNCDLLYFIFVQISLENDDVKCWFDIVQRTFIRYIAKHTFVRSSETKAW